MLLPLRTSSDGSGVYLHVLYLLDFYITLYNLPGRSCERIGPFGLRTTPQIEPTGSIFGICFGFGSESRHTGNQEESA